MPKFIDLQGRRFGRLIVLYRDMTGHSNDRHTYWVCRCDCGRLKTVRSDGLRSGLVVSCGCYHAEVSSKIGSYINLKHGMSNSRLYKIWVGIKSRCYNKNVPAYKDYGGRGIFVCQSWAENFGEFEKWSFEHGYSDDLEVDRIDNNGPYSPPSAPSAGSRWRRCFQGALNVDMKMAKNLWKFITQMDGITELALNTGKQFSVRSAVAR